MFIWKSTQTRCNPNTKYTAPDGTRYTKVPAELYEEIPDPVRGNDETQYTTEIDEPPYVVITDKSPEQLAQVRWNKLKAIRDNLTMNGGAKVGTNWFHSDTHSKVQQLALMMAGANLPAGIQWKTMDGSFVEMTPTLAQQIYAAQMAQEQAIFQVAETKRLDTSDVNAGWPETYSAN